MKIAALLLACLLSASAHAGHAIYKSIARQKYYGNAQVQSTTARGFLVFNPDTHRGTAVVGLTLNGLKLFTIVELQKHRVDRVTGPRGSTYTIISKAESPGTQFAGTLTEAVSMRGKDLNVIFDGQVRSLPMSFTAVGRSIAHNDQTGLTIAGESSGSFALDIKASRASNLSETHDDAVNRLAATFILRGYTRVIPPPAEP